MKMSFTTKLRLAGYAAKSLISKPVYWKYRPMHTSFMNDTRAAYRHMLQAAPLFWSPYTMGWHLSCSPAEIGKWMKDERLTTTFSSWAFAPKLEANTEFEKMLAGQLMSLSDADHRRVRKLVSPAFSPRFAETLRPLAQAEVAAALAQSDNNGLIDVCALTRDIPSRILAHYIGVPMSSLADFNALGQSVMASFDTTAKPDIAGAERGIALLKTLMAEKRAKPDDSFLSTLVNHVEDGERISEMEAVALMASLFAAGVATTSDALNTAIYTLAMHSGWSAWLAQHPERSLDVLTEATRWHAGTHRGYTRFAKEDLHIHGHTVRKGEMLQLMSQTSAFDELTFHKACEFNPARDDLKNFVFFGEGNHYCLGHALAKLITETALLAMVQRYPQLTLVKAPSIHYAISAYHMDGLVVQGSQLAAQTPNAFAGAAHAVQQAA